MSLPVQKKGEQDVGSYECQCEYDAVQVQIHISIEMYFYFHSILDPGLEWEDSVSASNVTKLCHKE